MEQFTSIALVTAENERAKQYILCTCIRCIYNKSYCSLQHISAVDKLNLKAITLTEACDISSSVPFVEQKGLHYWC